MSQRTHEAPAAAVVTGAVGVPAGSLSTVFGVDPQRRASTIVNQGTVPVWISATPSRATANGFYLPVGAGYAWSSSAAAFAFVDPAGAVDGLLYVITESGDAG